MKNRNTNKLYSHFSSSIIEIISNNKNLIGFKYGANSNINDNKYEKERIRIKYLISSLDNDIKTVNSLSHKLSSGTYGYIVGERSLPFGISANMVVDYSDRDYPKVYTNRTYEFWSRLRGTCAFEYPEEILSNIVTVQLLNNGYIPIHCACVERDNTGIIIIAPSNTGKTLTTWRLVSKFGFNFVSEDISIIKDAILFGCPYTASGLPDEIAIKQKKSFNPIKNLFFPNIAKKCIAGFIKNEQIKIKTSISKVYFLRIDNYRSQNVLSKERAKDLILKNNMLEFRYRSNRMLLELWYRYGYPNIMDINDFEIKGLESMISQTDDIREIVVCEAEEFAKVIAENR